MHATPIYAAFLAIIFVVLSVRTIRLRRRLQVGVGYGGHPSLERACRAQANFAEYVPLALLLIFFVELEAGSTWLVHVLAGGLLIGRTIHACGISRVNEDYRLRVAGMSLTFLAIGGASIRLLLGLVF